MGGGGGGGGGGIGGEEGEDIHTVEVLCSTVH